MSEELRKRLEKEIVELRKRDEKKGIISDELGFRLLVYGVLYGTSEDCDFSQVGAWVRGAR